ncbi:MAG TPA: ATP-binding protein [Vicinamibacterales bacterium]|nr:ATP-binding protein [Vicinamibacterales bacterium]
MFAPATDRRDRHTSLIVLLVLLTLLPAACVLWFMNEAVQVQADASRRTTLEGYRAQLRLVRSRVEASWQAYAARLNGRGTLAQRFTEITLDEGGDGAILFDERGGVAFPIESRLQTLDAALRPSLQPMVVLSSEVAARGGLALVPGAFQQTAVSDVWAFTSADRMTVVLFRTTTIQSIMHDLLHEVQPSGILFNTFAPNEKADMEAIAAGAALPGWQLSFFEPLESLPVDDSGARRQTMAYVAVAASGLAATVLIAVMTGSVFRRQLRLARLKTDLVASVSHELRTPLASMRVLVDGLLADTHLDETKTREYLHLVASENARLTRLIENFLTFSRLERGRERFAFSAVSPSAAVNAAVAAIRERVPQACDLTIEISPDLPAVRADEGALISALINLLDNALKYTPDQKRVSVKVERTADGVAFQVQDNGIGIAPREHRRIFKRFYRVDQSLASATSGVGLGLSIVELIARAHGGSVSVQSAQGSGSTFTLTVPYASAGALA